MQHVKGERAPLYQERTANLRALATDNYTIDVSAKQKDSHYGMRPEELLEEARQRLLTLKHDANNVSVMPRMDDNRLQAELARDWVPFDPAEMQAQYEAEYVGQERWQARGQQPEQPQEALQGTTRRRRASVLLPLAEKVPGFITGILQQRRILPQAEREWASSAEDATPAEAALGPQGMADLSGTLGRGGRSRRNNSTVTAAYSAPLPVANLSALSASIHALPSRRLGSGEQVLLPERMCDSMPLPSPHALGGTLSRSNGNSLDLIRGSTQGQSTPEGGSQSGSTAVRSGDQLSEHLSLDSGRGGEDEEGDWSGSIAMMGARHGATAAAAALLLPHQGSRRLPSLPAGKAGPPPLLSAFGKARSRRFSSLDLAPMASANGSSSDGDVSYAAWAAAAVASCAHSQGGGSGAAGEAAAATPSHYHPQQHAHAQHVPLHRLATPPLGALGRLASDAAAAGSASGHAALVTSNASPRGQERRPGTSSFHQVSASCPTAPWVQSLAAGATSRAQQLALQTAPPRPPTQAGARQHCSLDLPWHTPAPPLGMQRHAQGQGVQQQPSLSLSAPQLQVALPSGQVELLSTTGRTRMQGGP